MDSDMYLFQIFYDILADEDEDEHVRDAWDVDASGEQRVLEHLPSAVATQLCECLVHFHAQDSCHTSYYS